MRKPALPPGVPVPKEQFIGHVHLERGISDRLTDGGVAVGLDAAFGIDLGGDREIQTVGRPHRCGNPTREARERPCLAPVERKEIDLTLTSIATREKCEGRTIG